MMPTKAHWDMLRTCPQSGWGKTINCGTYRDVEVEPHPSVISSACRVEKGFTYGRVILRGLNADESGGCWKYYQGKRSL